MPSMETSSTSRSASTSGCSSASVLVPVPVSVTVSVVGSAMVVDSNDTGCQSKGVTSSAHERGGRPPATSRVDLERTALALFAAHGFAETTVEEIAEAAGVGRRTFFRYFDSKNDVMWGEFDALLADMGAWLAAVDDDVPTVEALRQAVVRFNSLPPEAVPAHRERMALILRVPALQAHSTLRYAAWREVVAAFAARRLDAEPHDFGPQLLGHLALGAAVAAYEQWLGDEQADLPALLTTAFGALPGEPDLTRRT
jgi:TetR/AcrR family transcriptional regulator, regulator of mycofactocin system